MVRFAKNDGFYCLHQLVRLSSDNEVSCNGMNFNPPFYEVHKLDKEQVLKLGVGKTRIFLSAKMPLTQCESPPFRGI